MKQLFNFSKKLRYPLYVMALMGAILFFNACRKTMTVEEESQFATVERAKNWFAAKVVQPENNMLRATQNYTDFKNGIRYFNRMHKIDKVLDWDAAEVFNLNGSEVVIAPDKQGAKPFSNKNFEAERYLVFYEDRKGDMQLSVVELLSRKSEALNVTTANVFKAFANKMQGKNESLGNLNAYITFYDKYYNPEARVQVINGQSSEGKFNIRNSPKRTVTTGGRGVTCGGGTCETWYLVGFWYDLNTGQVIDYEILDVYEVCSGGGGYDGPPYGYSGDPYDNNPPPPPPLNPCEQANSLKQNAAFISKMQDLQTKTSQNYESAYFMRPDGSGGTNYTYMNGGAGGTSFNFTANDFNGVSGFIHNHENDPNNLSIFSPDDLVAMAVAVTQGSVTDPNTFTFGLVTAQGTSYVLAVNDLTKFTNFANNNFVGAGSGTAFSAFSNFFNLMVNTSNTAAQNEANFVSILNTFSSGTGLTLLKGNSQFNQWQQVSRNSSGNATYTNC